MRPRRLSAWVLAAVLAALAWVFLAPPALGGQTSWVVTRGISMQPVFHTGDLALVREQDAYEVGDVIAYHSPTLDIVVLHRIISGDAQDFHTQGDNNSWVDPDLVPADQVIGKLWLHVPRVGTYLRVGTLVPVALVLVATAVALPVRARARRRGHRSRRKGPAVQPTPRRSNASAWLTTGTVAVVSGLALLLVSLRASAPPPEVSSAAVLTHQLELTYQAPGDPAVYQGGELVTGDPVFLDLNPVLDVRVRESDSGDAAALPRSLSLGAHLIGASGLQFDRPLGTAAVAGEHGSELQVTVDLRDLRNVIAQAEARTGYSGGSSRLELSPSLLPADPAAAGAVDFPPVVFQFQGDLLVLEAGDQERGAPVTRTATEPTRGTQSTESQEKQVRFAGASMAAAPLRVAGVAGVALGALLSTVGFVLRRRDPLSRLTQPLISVSGEVPARAVEITSLDELFGVAKRYDRPVLRVATGDRYVYLVEEEGTWYRSVEPGSAAPRGDLADEDAPTLVITRHSPPPPGPTSPRAAR
jgi:signal peptidase I